MVKRGRGEGAVYLRGDGRWEAQLRLPSGRRKSVYAGSRIEVITRLADVSWRSLHGLPIQAARGCYGSPGNQHL